MVSPCRTNRCGLRDHDKNNYTCLNCRARAAIALDEEWTEADIPSELIPEPPPTSPYRKKKKRVIKSKSTCKAEGCSRPAGIKGLCRACYQRNRYWSKKGQKSPSRPKIKPASKKPIRNQPALKVNLINNPYLSEADILRAVFAIMRIASHKIDRLADIITEEAMKRSGN